MTLRYPISLTFHAAACALLAGVFLTASAAVEKVNIFDAGAQQWKRTPAATVPRMPAPPKIDGTVDRAEWMAAADLGPFKVGLDGLAGELNRRAWIGHDATTLYIAFSIERPAGVRAPAIPDETGHSDGSGSAKASDVVELMFAPGLQFGQSYSVWLHANGSHGDARLKRSKDMSWDPKWTQAARVTETGWEGELAIPFAAFGLDGPPAPGQWWGFDVVDNQASPFRLQSHWSYRGGVWHNYENFGRIRFAGDVAVRLTKVGEGSDGRIGQELELVNATNEARTVTVVSELRRRKTGEAGGAKSYFSNIESGVSHDAQAEFTKGVSLAEMITFSEGFYSELSDAPARKVTLEIPAGARRTAGVTAELPYGEYLARYRVENGAGELLAAGANVFRREPALALRTEPYWLYSQLIDVFADLGKTGLKGEGELLLNLLPGEGDGAPLRSARTKVSVAAGDGKGTLDVKEIKPGFYRIEAVLFDGAGKELARNTSSIQRPEFPEWYKNDHGNKTAVPPPWTAVAAKDNGRVDVWGRTYDLSTVFPASVTITSLGRKVSAEPVRLVTRTAQGPVTWKVAPVKLLESTPSKAVYSVSMQGGGLILAGTMTAEFDGLIWYRLQATPMAGPVDLQSMTLDIPVDAGFAELMSRHKFLADPVLQSALPAPELNGMPGVLEDAKMPFTPYLWAGNEQAGMGFVAEAPMDWSIDKPNRVLETKPSVAGQPARVLAHIVQSPVKVEKAMRLEFGLQATPIRATPEDRSVQNIFQRNNVFDEEEDFKKIVERGGKVVVFYYDWRGNSKTEMGGTPERPVDPAQREKLKRAVERAHKHGLKVIMFTGWGVNAVSENWKKFSYELGRYPIENQGWGTFGQSAGENGAYADFMAWGHADLVKEYGVDGVLWDSTANIVPDRNLRIGNAWIDAQGRVRPKYAVLATRDVYRRVYNVYKAESGKDGMIYNHSGSMWPVNVFADMQNRGEGRPHRAKSLRDSWVPFEEFRAEYSAEPFGTLYSGEVNDWDKLPMRVSTHLTVTLLHGTYAKEYSLLTPARFRSYDYETRPVMQLWSTFNWLPMDGKEIRRYYYQNAKGKYQAVKATPATLLSSAFVSGDKKRALIVVSNLDETPVPGAEIEIDAKSLGLAAGAFKIEDGVTLTPVAHEGGRVKLDIDQQRYRLLKVSVE